MSKLVIIIILSVLALWAVILWITSHNLVKDEGKKK